MSDIEMFSKKCSILFLEMSIGTSMCVGQIIIHILFANTYSKTRPSRLTSPGPPPHASSTFIMSSSSSSSLPAGCTSKLVSSNAQQQKRTVTVQCYETVCVEPLQASSTPSAAAPSGPSVPAAPVKDSSAPCGATCDADNGPSDRALTRREYRTRHQQMLNDGAPCTRAYKD
jgi:hypothetical protein